MSNLQTIKYNTVSGQQTQKASFELMKDLEDSQIIVLYKAMQQDSTKQFSQLDIKELFGVTNIASRLFSPLFKAGYIRAGSKILGDKNREITSYIISNSNLELDFDKIREAKKFFDEKSRFLNTIKKLQELLINNENNYSEEDLDKYAKTITNCVRAFGKYTKVFNEFHQVKQDLNSCLEYLYKKLE